jgi:hypothetical protein
MQRPRGKYSCRAALLAYAEAPLLHVLHVVLRRSHARRKNFKISTIGLLKAKEITRNQWLMDSSLRRVRAAEKFQKSNERTDENGKNIVRPRA